MAGTIRAIALTVIIHATAITPILLPAIIRAPITIISPVFIVPIPTTTGAIGIEGGGRSARLVRSHRCDCAPCSVSSAYRT